MAGGRCRVGDAAKSCSRPSPWPGASVVETGDSFGVVRTKDSAWRGRRSVVLRVRCGKFKARINFGVCRVASYPVFWAT